MLAAFSVWSSTKPEILVAAELVLEENELEREMDEARDEAAVVAGTRGRSVVGGA